MKKAILFVMVAALALITVVGLAACVTTTKGTDCVAKDYNAADVDTKLDAMRYNGYLFKYTVNTVGDEESEDVGDFTYAAKGDVFYIETVESKIYYDLSSADYKDVYSLEGDGVWTKERTYYADGETKADAITEAKNAIAAHIAYMTYYDSAEEATADNMVKTTGEIVLGRTCDKYEWGMNIKVLFVKANTQYECYIDTETGICLKWSIKASASVGGADSGIGGVNFECTEFDTSCTLSLPDVTEENTTVVDNRQ